jgi:hypothetical protein
VPDPEKTDAMEGALLAVLHAPLAKRTLIPIPVSLNLNDPVTTL